MEQNKSTGKSFKSLLSE